MPRTPRRRSYKVDARTGKRKIGSGGRKGSASLRAYASLEKGAKKAIRTSVGGGKRLSRAQRVKVGRAVRKHRIRGGKNPNTGR